MYNDKVDWNKKYLENKPQTLPPEPFLVKHSGLLRPISTVLDLACGLGRNALYLAGAGHSVIGVDISDVALGQLSKIARDRNVSVLTREMDLDDPERVNKLGKYDFVLVNHFCPGAALRMVLPSCLKPKGLLMVCAFNLKQHEMYQFPKKFCLAPRELEVQYPDLELVKYETYLQTDQHLDGYVFRKK